MTGRHYARLALGLITLLSADAGLAGATTYRGSFKGHDYYTGTNNYTFSSARTEAAALGATLGKKAYLAAITTREEREFLACLLGTSSFYWVGLERLPGLPRDAYRWAGGSGEPFVYDPLLWYPMEPNDLTGVEYAGIFPWFDGACTNDGNGSANWLNGGLIEIEVNE